MVASKRSVKSVNQKSRRPPLGDMVWQGFGYGIGFGLAQLIFTGVGVILFIVGFVMWKRESKKSKEEQRRGMLITGIVLMGIGCVLGFSFGGMMLLTAIGGEL